MASSLAKKTRGSSAVDTSRIYSDGRSRVDKCNGGPELFAKLRRGNKKGLL